MRNLIKERREVGAICSKCRSPDYKMFVPECRVLKPVFTCNSCCNSWNYGSDGGKFAALATKEKEAK